MTFKKIKLLSTLIAVLMLVCFAFSGCNFIGAFDGGIEEIMQPPIYDTEKYNINLVLNNVTKGSITLKLPKEGSFITAYTEFDIDGDKNNEAVVFYQEKIKDTDKTNLYIHLFRKDDDGEWISAQRIESKDSDVYSLEFCDLNKDGIQEIIVMWDRISLQNTKTLAIYEYKNGNLEYGVETVCDAATTIDLIPDNNSVEVVSFGFDADTSNSVAEAYIYNNKSLVTQGSGAVELSDEIIGYAKVSPSPEQYVNGNKYYARVIVDSYYRSVQTLFTQFVYWNNNTLKVSRLDAALEKRNVDITSRDINYDGVIEFPSVRAVSSVTKYGKVSDDDMYYAIAWLSDYEIQSWPVQLWTNTVYTVYIPDFDFTLQIPSDWWDNAENIAIEKDEENNRYVIYKFNSDANKLVKSYMSVRIFKNTEWDDDSVRNGDEDVFGKELKYTKVKTNKTETLVYAIGSVSGEVPSGVELIVNE